MVDLVFIRSTFSFQATEPLGIQVPATEALPFEVEKLTTTNYQQQNKQPKK